MADDTPTTIRLIDGTGQPVDFNATTNVAQDFTLQSTPRTNGAIVSAGNPMPVVDASVATGTGVSGSGISFPAGGSGILGWLSGIYQRLLGTLAVADSAGNTLLTTISGNTTGLATASAQTTGNTSLATVATNTTGLATASAQTTGNGSLATIATNTSGSATASAQATGNTSLATIVTNTTGLATASGQTTGNGSAATTATNTGTIAGAVSGGKMQIQATVPTLAYSAPTTGTAGTSSGTLIAAGAFTRILTIATLPASTTNVWLNPAGGASVVGQGHLVGAGGGSWTYGTAASPMPTTLITAITDGGGGQTVTITGG